MPQREARFSVPAPPGELWRFIRDFEALCSCIPGAQQLEVIDERTARLTVQEKVGVVPLFVELTARIESETPPWRLLALATAEHLTMRIEVTLAAHQAGSGERADGGGFAGTTMTTLFDVRGEGPLKPVVDRLFERRASERTQQFAASLEQRFGAAAAAMPQPPAGLLPSTGEAPHRRAWFSRLLRLLRQR